jgi:outer membrane protein OmpA-like peptidoglycan-associated protein
VDRLFRWGWTYVSGRGWVVPPRWVPPQDFVVPPGWYYLPTQTYTTFGFYNPGAVTVVPGAARRDLITTIDTSTAYMPAEDVPAIVEELPAPPPRPMPETTPQLTEVQTKTEVVETLTRERKLGDRYSGPVLVTQTIHFDYDSYAIKPESFPALDAIGEALVNPPLDKAIINVEGHTDSDGSNEYNQTLSERRAWSVKSYLVQKFGIDPNRLVIVGYGEEAPIATNDNDAGKAVNRRVEFENVTDLYGAQQAPESAVPAAAATQ